MQLTTLDWVIIAAFFVMTLAVGFAVTKRAGKNTSEFFLSGRSMPWWLLGFSMVATTFSADTPNLVTDLVRSHGVAGNWVWWAFLLTGMLTVFVYAKLWRRSGAMTDVEFYELRYSGKPAAFLRGFRAIYLGLFFNVMIMSTVTLAAIKIGGVMLGLSPWETVLIAGLVTVAFSTAGGLTGVVWTDFVLFLVAMTGAVAAAVVAVNMPQVGGLSGLLSHAAADPKLGDKLSLLPDMTNMNEVIPLLIIPLAVQWWSVWYPGAEPGGGGYIAQRMLSAKDEKHATGATLFFNCAHYALRPWPWILVALASMIVFPDIQSLHHAFPHMPMKDVKNDMAYPAMLTFLPPGLMGLVLASLIAAYVSTIATHLNWGSSYLVNDFWRRFARPEANEKELVLVGRVCTVLLMVLAAFGALVLSNALQAFNILLLIGAGTGLLFLLRWFWWRINPWSELTGMIASFLFAIVSQFILQNKHLSPVTAAWPSWIWLVTGVAVTTVTWLAVTLVTSPSDDATLRKFYRLTRPGGAGWKPVLARAEAEGDALPPAERGVLPMGILCMLLGCMAVYTTIFATGYWLYGWTVPALILTLVAVGSAILLLRLWPRVATRMHDEQGVEPPQVGPRLVDAATGTGSDE